MLPFAVAAHAVFLIVVHLKSGRGAAEQGIRDQQAAIISHFINSELTERPRQDIILLGDFNVIPGQDVSNFHILGGDDKMDLAVALPNTRLSHPHIGLPS